MFTKRITLFRLLGFEVKIDMTWLILALLVTWSLAEGAFPFMYKGLKPSTYWLMGLGGTVLLLFSIVFHELCHSLVARHYGFPIKGITLFIFGGVAEMDEEPPFAKAEFFMAAAGPLASAVLAGMLYVIYQVASSNDWPVPVLGVTAYMGYLNIVLAVFNLVPAFPLDGGRMLRAGLWGWRDDFRWATRLAARIGSAFGMALILLGVFAFISGQIIAGMWWALIGMFLRGAAGMSYRQLLVQEVLKGEGVRRFMNSSPVVVPAAITLQELIEDYIYRYHFKMFPVVEQGRLLGSVGVEQVKAVDREAWAHTRVGDVMTPSSGDNTVAPETDAMKAWSQMRNTGQHRLMVARDARLLGLLSMRDLMEFLSVKFDLGEPE